jgi:hypothetical protein
VMGSRPIADDLWGMEPAPPAANPATSPGRELHKAAWRPADLAYAQLAREIPGLRVSRYFARQGTRKVESDLVHAEMTEALTRLTAELDAQGYCATLVVRGGLWRPSVVVRNPAVAVRTTEIIAESGWFWWPMAYRLCEVGEAARAAGRIIHVLCLGSASGD